MGDAQTRPGGKILTPWGTSYHNGALASFTVRGDGSAEGRIDETTARTSQTSVAPYSVAGDYDASLAMGMKVPGCSVIIVPDPTAELTGTLWFVDPDTDSWADLHYQRYTRSYPVHQCGPRNLWDEIEAAYHWWRDAGRPGPPQWRITLTPEGQHVSLIEVTTPAGAKP